VDALLPDLALASVVVKVLNLPCNQGGAFCSIPGNCSASPTGFGTTSIWDFTGQGGGLMCFFRVNVFQIFTRPLTCPRCPHSNMEHMRRRASLGRSTRDRSLLALSIRQHVSVTPGGVQDAQATAAARPNPAAEVQGFTPRTHTLSPFVCPVYPVAIGTIRCSCAQPYVRDLRVRACCHVRPCPLA
jgi:hypothetical protein